MTGYVASSSDPYSGPVQLLVELEPDLDAEAMALVEQRLAALPPGFERDERSNWHKICDFVRVRLPTPVLGGVCGTPVLSTWVSRGVGVRCGKLRLRLGVELYVFDILCLLP